MFTRTTLPGLFLALVLIAASSLLRAQSFNASISGTVTDPTGAVVPEAQLTLTAVATAAVAKFTTGTDGLYAFRNLSAGAYELKVSAKGFRDYWQRGIAVSINESVRVDVPLELGAAVQTVEVIANASPLNFENAELKEAITPETLRELPLLVGGAIRSAAAFVILMPGVSTGGGANPFDARINGGLQSGDEAVLDGVTLQQGTKGQSGMVSAYSDYPWSPEAISEVSVLTSNYEPQYGSTTSAVITAITKSGTNEFHGSLYEFHRNTSLNARQFGIPDRPKDIENDFGGNLSGPIKIPWLAWTGRKKTYGFVNYEGFRIRGGATTPIISIPSLKERQGDFSDWLDTEGNLIPIYDPATTRPDPNNPGSFLRDQFMGCDGNTPNVICPTDPRLENSLAKQWLKFLPEPTFPGPLNNYVVPVPIPQGVFADSTLLDVRIDHEVGNSDRIFATVHYRGSTGSSASLLPAQLSTESPFGVNYSFVDRLNWDHTFTPSLLNHFAFGYLDTFVEVTCFDRAYADQLPRIPGAISHDWPPVLDFEDFYPFGCNGEGRDTRPTFVGNDLLTWVRGKHTLKFGGEVRKSGTNGTGVGSESGFLYFSRLGSGLLGLNSGNAIASLLLEQVDSGSLYLQSVASAYPRASTYSLHFGDTWKAASKLSINYGLRWDLAKPTVEKFDNLSFLDPLGPNPGAGGRLGRLAFAGTKWGDASFGRRHPEKIWYRAFAPRLGIAYGLSPKNVVRAGYGIFYTQAFYPGWGGGIAQDGFNADMWFASSDGGMTPAFILSEGFPPIPPEQRPPFIDPSFRNGQSLTYRPFDANRLGYAQQWNLTLEHQFTENFYVSAAYVGNKGTRLASVTAPLNALDPKYLSMGAQLYDEFQPGDTELHGVPIPYDGWIEQMTGCAPSVAQALLPYPQYCSGLYGLNENAGNSTYHSFQLKVEKRFSQGVWMLGSYTNSKLLTSSDNTQDAVATIGATHGVLSPFQRQRNKALAIDDTPQIISLALVHQLPFGKGKRFLDQGGVVDKILGGWEVTSIFRASSGVPFSFRSSNCNVPGEFRAACIPAILPGAYPWAQGKGTFDPNGPLFNAAAFEHSDPAGFQFEFGQGPRISNLRGFGFHNQDLGLLKNTRITEKWSVQFRAEFFNVWNWHIFGCTSMCWGYSAFDTDSASPSFGMWNGLVSAPRNIQLGLKVLF
jgi:hypothetical protein